MGTRQRPDAAAYRFDALTAFGLAVMGAVMVWLSDQAQLVPLEQPLWVAFVGAVLIAAPLVMRRRWPVTVAVVQSIVYIVFAELGAIEYYASQVCLFMGLYSVGAWSANRRRAFWARLVIVVAMAIWFVTSYLRYFDQARESGATVTMYLGLAAVQAVINVAFFVGAWVFGNRQWRAAIEREKLERAHREIVEAHEQLAQQAVALDRVRIARELHDVVAHHVSAMGIQAGAARRVLTRDPQKAEESLRHVEQSAREAIGELRTMVGTLRNSEGEDLGPAPTLAQLPDLLGAARSTGQRVEFDTVGEPLPLSPSVELTVYRVIQEALTNARKHAGPDAVVKIRLRYSGGQVEVEVADDGTGHLSEPGSGAGLVGMRERVTALGGEVHTGPRPRGGWLVQAAIPVAPARQTSSEAELVDSSAQAKP